MHLFHAEIKKLLAVAVFFAIHYLFSFHLCHTRDVSSNECSPACFIGRNARIIIRITVCVCVCARVHVLYAAYARTIRE